MIIFTDGVSIKTCLVAKLCECVAKYNPTDIVVREKQLTDDEYDKLIVKIKNTQELSHVKIWINGRPSLARRHNMPLHIGYAAFCTMDNADKFSEISVAVHSKDEAIYAEKNQASRVVFGHIFANACKAGLPPRGLVQLAEVAKALSIDVLAIGGINRQNVQSVLDCGASDYCIMSSAMQLSY